MRAVAVVVVRRRRPLTRSTNRSTRCRAGGGIREVVVRSRMTPESMTATPMPRRRSPAAGGRRWRRSWRRCDPSRPRRGDPTRCRRLGRRRRPSAAPCSAGRARRCPRLAGPGSPCRHTTWPGTRRPPEPQGFLVAGQPATAPEQPAWPGGGDRAWRAHDPPRPAASRGRIRWRRRPTPPRAPQRRPA